jgi:peptide/nickel transport system substrate-binding protein
VADALYFPDLNPTDPQGSVSLAAEAALFDDLFRYDSRSRLYPMMATAVPTSGNGGVRDGGRTIVIHLKRGLRWSNDSEITSADVRFGWQINMDSVSGPGCAGTCDVIRSIDTPDRYTAVLHLDKPSPALISPSLLFGGNMPPIWPARWPGWTNNPHAAALRLFKDPSYTFSSPAYPTDGPYQVVRLEPKSAALRPMPYYDDMSCGAWIRNLDFTTYSTANSASDTGQIQAAISGRIDVGLDFGAPALPSLLPHQGRYVVHIEPTYSFEVLQFNIDPTYQGRPNPLASAKVRLSLALALDKLGLIRTVLPVTSDQATQVEAWTPWVNTPTLVQPYADPHINGQWDPLANHGRGAYVSSTGSGEALADARRLLAATPWRHGFRLDTFTTKRVVPRVVAMAAVARQWKRIGVNVVQHPVLSGDLFQDWQHGGILAHGAFQAGLFAWYGNPNPDPLSTLMESRYIDRDQRVHTVANQNYTGIRDPVIDRSFDEAGQTFNKSVRTRDFFAIQQRMNRRAYWIPLYFRPDVSTSDHRIVGFEVAPTTPSWGWNIYDWKVR